MNDPPPGKAPDRYEIVPPHGAEEEPEAGYSEPHPAAETEHADQVD